MRENGAATAAEVETEPPPPAPRRAGRGQRDRRPLIFGSILLGLGALMMLRHLDVIGRLGAALAWGTVLFGIAGLCLHLYGKDPDRRWGFLLPAGFFASLGTVVSANIVGLMPGPFVPLVFFAGPAAGFFLIYRRERTRTWALVCAWLTVVTGFAGFVGSIDWIGGLGWPAFFWGIAAAFAWHFLRTGNDWTLIPAGLGTTVGLTIFLNAIHVPSRLLWSVLLVGVGASLGVYYLFGKPGQVRWAAAPAVIFAVLGVLAVLAGPLITFGVPIAFVAFGLYLLLFYGKEEAS